MTDEPKATNWWHTLPGVLTAAAGVITAITGLIVAFSNVGFLKVDKEAVPNADASEAGNTIAPTVEIGSKGPAPARPPVTMVNQAAEVRAIDNPLPLALGTTYKLTLEANEESYFRFTASAREIKIVLDMQMRPKKNGHISSTLSLLDADGAVADDNIISLSQYDTGFRETKSLGVKPGTVAGFKLMNRGVLADLWLTVLPEPAAPLVPFFGEIVPAPISSGRVISGALEADEHIYYTVSLPKGDYKVILDFATPDKKPGHLDGKFALLDADGGNYRRTVTLGQYVVSYRTTGTFTMSRDQTQIIRLENGGGPANYSFRIQPVT
jgi:hypothetical protein